METKKVIATALIALGLLGLVPGVLGIFEGGEIIGQNPWALTIIGFILFVAGIGILKTVGARTEVEL